MVNPDLICRRRGFGHERHDELALGVKEPDLVAFGLDVDGLSKVGEEGVLHLHEFGTAHAAGGAELREVELVALECPAADEKIAACVAGDLAVGAELDGRRDFTFLGGTVGPH